MKYRYETPIWAVRLLCTFAIAVSIACFAGFFIWVHWAGNAPVVSRWALLLIAVGFLLAGLKQSNWKPWRYFYADDIGIHFPSECPETKDTKWLSVPWVKVGNIQKEHFVSRQVGPTLELLLSKQEIDQYFRDVKLTKLFFGKKPVENGYSKVGYSNVFNNPDKAVRVLNEYKEKYT